MKLIATKRLGRIKKGAQFHMSPQNARVYKALNLAREAPAVEPPKPAPVVPPKAPVHTRLHMDAGRHTTTAQRHIDEKERTYKRRDLTAEK